MLRIFRQRPRRVTLMIITLTLLTVVAAGAVLYGLDRLGLVNILHGEANTALIRWFAGSAFRPALTTSFEAPCPGYPFLVPTSGLVGGLPWNATYGPYNIRNPHPGIDIFGNGDVGTIPVYAAYDGLLTRESHWTSAVTIRHEDPLNPGEIIWTYYTHMANIAGDVSFIADRFPRGATDVPVQQGELIGYQGVYNGGINNGLIGLHLHFSIVKSDSSGDYLNEIYFNNTLDPTPYLGLNLNDTQSEEFPLRCNPAPLVNAG